MDYETAVEFGLIPDVMSQNVFNASYFADGYNGVADFVLKRTQEILVSDNIRDKIMRFANERIYRTGCLMETMYNVYNGKMFIIDIHVMYPDEFRLGDIVDNFAGGVDVYNMFKKAALCRANGYRIDNLLFIFPLLEKIVEYEIVGWDHVPLLSYMYSLPDEPEFQEIPKIPDGYISVDDGEMPDPSCVGVTMSNIGSIYMSVTSCDVKCIQIFLAGNTSTKVKITDLDYKNTKEYITETDRKLFIHAPYTINLSTITTDNFVVEALGRQLQAGIRLGASGVVIHVGKPANEGPVVGLANMRKNIISASVHATIACKILIETPAGQGSELLTNINDLYNFWDSLPVESKNVVAICVDTCHVFACGYDPHVYIQDLHTRGCPIEFIHFNDSKNPKNSRVDRHEHPGKGFIGNDLIKTLILIKKYNIPAVLES